MVMRPRQSGELMVYDTLRRDLRPVSARNGEVVHIYCCGPTVYRDAHIGNLRTFLLADLAVRTLDFLGQPSRLIQNITDVGHLSEDFEEDKVLAQSRIEARDPFDVARAYEAKFHTDCAALNISAAAGYPKASESIQLMIKIIEELLKEGFAYIGEDGSVYFDARKFPSYGALSGNRLDALKPGHRYEFTEGGAKRFHADWALWKVAGHRTEMIWDTPWGRGFPGWHIECTAMSLNHLAGHIDLHIGGIDLRFPHHENERAQSNPITGDEAVDLWLHGEHLLFEGRKMSKSAGNVVLLGDICDRGLDPLALRFCFLENRYRSQMDLSWNSIIAAHARLRNWRQRYQSWLTTPATESDRASEIIKAISGDFAADLDTPKAILRLRELERSELPAGELRTIFESVEPLFGLDLLKPKSEPELPPVAEQLLIARQEARAARDFSTSDRLRSELASLGIDVRDTPEGQIWVWAIN